MRQLIESYASELGLHLTLSGVFPNDVSDRPGTHRDFNKLPPQERVRIARAALASAGERNLAPGRAFDAFAEKRDEDRARLTDEDRELLHELLEELNARRPPGRDCERKRHHEDTQVEATDQGPAAWINKGVTDTTASARALSTDCGTMSDLEQFERDAAACCGGY